jgi:hypothetical protein
MAQMGLIHLFGQKISLPTNGFQGCEATDFFAPVSE